MLLPDAEYEYAERQVEIETVSLIICSLDEFCVSVPVLNAGTRGVANRDLPPIKVLNSKTHLINLNRNRSTSSTQRPRTTSAASRNSRA